MHQIFFCRNIVELLVIPKILNNSCIQHNTLQEDSILRAIQEGKTAPIETYYFEQKANLCDIPPTVHKTLHD